MHFLFRDEGEVFQTLQYIVPERKVFLTFDTIFTPTHPISILFHEPDPSFLLKSSKKHVQMDVGGGKLVPQQLPSRAEKIAQVVHHQARTHHARFLPLFLLMMLLHSSNGTSRVSQQTCLIALFSFFFFFFPFSNHFLFSFSLPRSALSHGQFAQGGPDSLHNGAVGGRCGA